MSLSKGGKAKEGGMWESEGTRLVRWPPANTDLTSRTRFSFLDSRQPRVGGVGWGSSGQGRAVLVGHLRVPAAWVSHLRFFRAILPRWPGSLSLLLKQEPFDCNVAVFLSAKLLPGTSVPDNMFPILTRRQKQHKRLAGRGLLHRVVTPLRGTA